MASEALENELEKNGTSLAKVELEMNYNTTPEWEVYEIEIKDDNLN